MVKNFILLFLALRAADLLNLAGGLYLVPKFVAPEDLGAVLPLTSFATLAAIPVFAIAMTALRESSRLRAEGQDRQLRSFIRGVFAAVGIGAVLVLAVTAAVLPHFLVRFRVSDSLSGYLAVTAAFLGCVAPVYFDQLQAAKRFGRVGVIEISAAALRLGVMAVIMPFRALAGYFAGSVVRPIVQIIGSLLVLHRAGGLQSSANQDSFHPYWNRESAIRLLKTFFLLLPYLGLPLLVSLTENDLVRTQLSAADSAGYYMATRISDLVNYVSYPLMFVMFPYVTDHAAQGKSHTKLTLNCCGIVICIAVLAAVITDLFGTEIISWLPNGENYTAYATHIPKLFLFMAFGAGQSIITNAEFAAGRFTFLWWLIPLNIAYIELLPRLMKTPTLDSLVMVFMLFALARMVIAWVQIRFVSKREQGQSLNLLASSDSDRSAR